MLGSCAACGADPGFEWSVCPKCGAAAPAGAPERTVIEPNRGPSSPAPAAGGERARLGTDRNYYRPVSRESTPVPASAPDATVVERTAPRADETVVLRPAPAAARSSQPRQPLGVPRLTGPLAYFVQRNGAAAGAVHQVADETGIGRSAENDIVVAEASVSKQHAKVRRKDGQFVYWDLASSNFSFLVGSDGSRTRILEPLPMRDGTTIDLGEARLTFVEVETSSEL